VNTKYIIRQQDKADREFDTGQQAVEYLVANPGHAKLFHNGELLMTKGIPSEAQGHDPQLFRGLFAAAAEA
jgi:hypothetical protein